MTIDEAIARERQLAKEQRSHIGTWDDEYSKKCEVYAEEHEQLAECLEELKMYKSLAPRELVSEKQRSDRNIEYHKGFKNGYNKAITDFSTTLVTRLTDAIHSKDVGSMRNLINEISEQLKDGGENETELPNIKDKDCKSIGYSYAYKTDCEGDRYIKLDEVMYFLKCERNKAIDDAVNEIVSVKSEVAEKEHFDTHLFTVLAQRQNEIIKLIKKLKEGNKNDD